jgi:serine phosphatase RsbU (regulator of sigma subunit)
LWHRPPIFPFESADDDVTYFGNLQQTGGDVDFVATPDQSLGIAIGDVSGHGFAAALVMALTPATLRRQPGWSLVRLINPNSVRATIDLPQHRL